MSYKIQLKQPGFIQSINADNFEDIALQMFGYQYENNGIYRAFADALGRIPGDVTSITDIPFLPISFFRTHKVVSGQSGTADLVFESSGTTGDIPSRHYVTDENIYREALMRGFTKFYGTPADYCILALLPSYLERKNASLVHMAKVLMEQSGHPLNGFYLDEWAKLAAVLQQVEAGGQKALLLGVTFALLDFAEVSPMQLQHAIVMETGGMKGRREEWTRTQVHEFLKEQLGLDKVHSEYGMTELLSQAYSAGDGVFKASPTMRVLVRDVNDPLDISRTGAGCLNIIDLANINSCAFIATEDIGHIHASGSFEVLGRLDHAALRGCNLMMIS